MTWPFDSMHISRNPLQRLYGRRDLHCVTFSCFPRRPYLGTVRARNCFVKMLDEVRRRQGFELAGYVVMPGHVHLLISEPPKGSPSKVLQVPKQRVARALRSQRNKSGKQMALPFAGRASEPPAFWQRRFYDFNVWSEKKFREKLHYVHRNPAERRLVLHPKDWPWSSWSFYERGEKGLIRVDVLKAKTEKSKSAPLNPKGAAPTLTSSPRCAT